MPRASWDERWRERLREDLEPALAAPSPAGELSSTQGEPFALFVYRPAEEREARAEIERLARRIEHQASRTVRTLSLYDLMDEALREAAPPDGKELLEAERAQAHMPPERRLEELRDQMAQILGTLPERILHHAASMPAERSILFLTRVGALYPAYRANALLDHLAGRLQVPTVLFYPGRHRGTNVLSFMGSLEGKHSYRFKVY